jgi:amino acid transporter
MKQTFVEPREEKQLGIVSITLLNVTTIFTVPLLLPSALCGGASIAYNFAGALGFLLPTAACAAELAAHYPDEQGLSGWVDKGLGKKSALLSAWCQFLNCITFFPSMQSFAAAAIVYPFSPDDSTNQAYLAITSCVMIWSLTFVCTRGINSFEMFTNIGAIVGGPVAVAILVFSAVFRGTAGPQNSLAITSVKDLLPATSNWRSTISYFTGIMYSYAGIEVSASHQRDMARPSINYPRACAASALIIVTLNLAGRECIEVEIAPACALHCTCMRLGV